MTWVKYMSNIDVNNKEYKLFLDFYILIEDYLLENDIIPSKYLIKLIMTRIDPKVVNIYCKNGVGDKYFTDVLYKNINEILVFRCVK